MIVSEVRKSQNFSNEKPFAVVRFRKSVEKESKFAVGSLNDGNSYSLTYNLSLIYPDVVDEDDVFNANEAFKTFKKEMKIGAEEPVNGFDISISEISPYKEVYVVETKRTMQTMRPACYGDRNDAIRIAKASLERQLREKTFKIVKEDDEDDEDE